MTTTHHPRRGAMAPQTTALILACCLAATTGFAADPPHATISNGQITAKMYLPDAGNGYYRSTRFDWSGAVFSVAYKGHEFYGPWYDATDPSVINWVHRGPEIVSGPCSALYGPVNEFQTPLGYNEAQAGGTFVKIGVGVLRKAGGAYNRFVPYEVVDAGTWTIKKAADSVEFVQELSDAASGYAYRYRKVVRLEKGRPGMIIEHRLENTGKNPIRSQVYNHNFVVIDKQPPGPDYTFTVPYEIQSTRPPNKDLADVRGNQVFFAKTLSGQDELTVFLQGFGKDPKDGTIVIANKKAGAGVKISGDRPVVRSFLWSIRSVLAVEPYVAVDIQPGQTFSWNDAFEYFTLPSGR